MSSSEAATARESRATATSKVREKPGSEGEVGDRLEAQDGVEGHGEQHAGHEGRDRGGRLAVGVGQPAVHRGQADLGAVAEDEQREPEPQHRRVEVPGVGHERRPVEGAGRVPPGVQGRQVDEHGAQEGQGDPDRADHDVLPRGFERALGPAMPDQEGGDDGGRLDRHPEHADVGGQDGEEHGGDERLDQHAVGGGPGAAGLPGGQLEGDGADAEPRSQEGDGADDHDHEGTEGVGAQHAPGSGQRAVPDHADADPDPEGQRGAVGGHPEPADPTGRRAPPSGGDGGAAEEGEDEDEQRAPSVVQLLELVEVEIAELDCAGAGPAP